MNTCKIEGCTKEVRVKKFQLCTAHYQRQWNGKDVEGPVRPVLVDGTPTYNAAHYRIYKARGKAKDYQCELCCNQAKHWALRADREMIIDSWSSADKGRMFSLNPEDYFAACVACHSAYDREHGLRVDAL